MGITSIQRLYVTVKKNIGISANYIPTNTQMIVPGGAVPHPPDEIKLASKRDKLPILKIN
jgi:hypothetical protein